MVSSKTLAETVMLIADGDTKGAAVAKFMTYLKEKNLLGLLPQILRHVERLSQNTAAADTLHVYTPYSLNKSDMAALVKIADAKGAITEEHIDESLVGGFSATYKGYIYNGSLSHQVDRFTQTLKQSS